MGSDPRGQKIRNRVQFVSDLNETSIFSKNNFLFSKISEKYVEKSRQTYFLDDHFSALRAENVFVTPSVP